MGLGWSVWDNEVTVDSISLNLFELLILLTTSFDVIFLIYFVSCDSFFLIAYIFSQERINFGQGM